MYWVPGKKYLTKFCLDWNLLFYFKVITLLMSFLFPRWSWLHVPSGQLQQPRTTVTTTPAPVTSPVTRITGTIVFVKLTSVTTKDYSIGCRNNSIIQLHYHFRHLFWLNECRWKPPRLRHPPPSHSRHSDNGDNCLRSTHFCYSEGLLNWNKKHLNIATSLLFSLRIYNRLKIYLTKRMKSKA